MGRSWVVGVTCGSHDVWVGHGWQGSRVGHMIYGQVMGGRGHVWVT